MENEPELYYDIVIQCRACKAKKKIRVPKTAPPQKGEVLSTKNHGEKVACIRCRKAQMEVLTDPPLKERLPGPVGWSGPPGGKGQ